MFLTGKVRVAMQRARQAAGKAGEERFDLPLFVRGPGGRFERHYGTLSLEGCRYRTCHPPRAGEPVEIRLVLIGTGLQARVQGRVSRVDADASGWTVTVRFEDLTDTTRQTIVHWLQLLSRVYRKTLAA